MDKSWLKVRTAVRRVLDIRLSIGELIGIGLVIGAPYLIIGVFWSASHAEHLQETHGGGLVASYIGSIVFWPFLLFSDVYLL